MKNIKILKYVILVKFALMFKLQKKDKGSLVIDVGPRKYRSGHKEYKGERPTMEDATIIFGDIPDKGYSYYAVFDGHGGNKASHYAGKNIHESFKKHFTQNGDSDVFKALKEAFKDINRQPVRRSSNEGSVAGIIVLSDEKVYSYNIGDVRAVMVYPDGKYERISHDHRANDPEERKFIEDHGGKVVQDRLQGILEVSRTLGDGELEKFINTEPFTLEKERIDGAKIILACDGVWDVLDDEIAAKIVLKHDDPNAAALDIADQAMQNHTTDNVSCIVIDLTRL